MCVVSNARLTVYPINTPLTAVLFVSQFNDMAVTPTACACQTARRYVHNGAWFSYRYAIVDSGARYRLSFHMSGPV